MVGIGVSNRPLIGFLLIRGAIVVARDKKTREEIGEYADEIEKQGAILKLGEDYLEDLDEEIIFVLPVFALTSPLSRRLWKEARC